MKGIICYYSSTGNTELACRYIANHSKGITFDLFNIAKDNSPSLESYDVIGFAAPTDFWGPPYLVQRFIDQIPDQKGKPAFVMNTYGLFSGKTLSILQEWVSAKGFKVVAGHSLQMPENYPPLVVRGIRSINAPKKKAINRFSNFVLELNRLLKSGQIEELAEARLKRGFMGSVLKAQPRTKAKDDMGNKYIDESLCVECGICKNVCPNGAIELKPKPVFNMEKCYGCWSCYNHCPNQAIYTRKIHGKGQYTGPTEALKEKLK